MSTTSLILILYKSNVTLCPVHYNDISNTCFNHFFLCIFAKGVLAHRGTLNSSITIQRKLNNWIIRMLVLTTVLNSHDVSNDNNKMFAGELTTNPSIAIITTTTFQAMSRELIFN